MAVTCKLQRRGDLSVDGSGYQISDVYLLEGHSVGLNKAAILSLSQSFPPGSTEDAVPQLGDSYGDPAVLCQRLSVTRISKDSAFITATFADSVVSFGGASNDARASGSIGRMASIEIPVFRRRTDVRGDQNYVLDPWRMDVPVMSRWYDGTVGAIQSQEPTVDQVWTALEGNIDAIHQTIGMRLVDYEQIIRPGTVRRVRLRFEAVAALPAFTAGFWGDNSPAIPALPRDAMYDYNRFYLPNVTPTINIKAASSLHKSWTNLPFTVTVTGPYGVSIQ